MGDQATAAARFLELHRSGQPLVMPNAWDQGSARLLASLAFAALGAVVEAARELLDEGTYGYRERAGVGLTAARAAFTR